MNSPSATGQNWPWTLVTRSAGSARAALRSATPSASNARCPAASAVFSVGTLDPPSLAVFSGANDPPLSEIAFANRPLAAGEAASMDTEMPPADSPKMVTLFSSPPNWAMLSFTHFRAAT